MDLKTSTELVSILSTYKPGRMLIDINEYYWIRRSQMSPVRYRFISPVGDNQEAFYEQKYLLNVPLFPEHTAITNPPTSWMQLCVTEGMCDTHEDCLTSIQSAISRGFNVDSVRELARLYHNNGFLSEDEADVYLGSIPVPGQEDLEPQADVTDQLLGDPDGDMRDMLPTRPTFDHYIRTFTPSQLRVYR